jgi:hypothetical protein
MTLPGFRFEERMAGTYRLLAEGTRERPIELTLTARAPALHRFLRSPVAELEGEADLEDFADHRPARGTMLLDLLVSRRIGYDLTFPDNTGAKIRFRGQKQVQLTHFAETMANLPAGLFDATGARIGEAAVRFHYSSDLLRFLRSWRFGA